MKYVESGSFFRTWRHDVTHRLSSVCVPLFNLDEFSRACCEKVAAGTSMPCFLRKAFVSGCRPTVLYVAKEAMVDETSPHVQHGRVTRPPNALMSPLLFQSDCRVGLVERRLVEALLRLGRRSHYRHRRPTKRAREVSAVTLPPLARTVAVTTCTAITRANSCAAAARGMGVVERSRGETQDR